MRIACARLALAALCALAAPAQAQMADRAEGSEYGFTMYGGFRGGGDLMEATTDEKLHVDTTPSFALAVDIAYEPRKQLQVFYSHQKGDLSSAAGALAPVQVPLTIEYLHIGGTAFLEGMGDGGYASAGIGATRLTPNSPGLAAETKPSLSIAFGYMLPLVPGLGLRFEARGYATWIDSNGSLFCRTSSGCPVSIKGNGFYQGDALIGLTARF